MRVGIDARELSSHPTGVGRYLAELLARWTRDAGAVRDTLVLFAPRPLDPTGPLFGTTGARCEVHPSPGGGGSRWEQISLAKTARAAALDVFFAPGYTAPLTLRVPVVVAMHDVSFAAHPEWFRRREGFRQRLLARQTARKAAAVVTLTEFSRGEIVRLLGVPPLKVTVIPPAVDAHPALAPTSEWQVGGAGDGPATILFVGSIFTRRHVPDLLDAFDQVAESHRVQLTLVGEDRSWPPQRIEEHIRRSPHAKDVLWFRWAPEADLRRLYRRARVFAFLSEYEGFGLTPLEALAAGAPPVVADVAGAHEAYGHAAHYVDPGDSRAIAEGLRLLLGDSDHRRRILASAPSVLGRYSWDASATRTLDAIRSAAQLDR